MASFAKKIRHVFIDARLAASGKINRSDIQNGFGVSAPQASSDLTEFASLHPARMKYCNRSKAYLSTESPLFNEESRELALSAARIFGPTPKAAD